MQIHPNLRSRWHVFATDVDVLVSRCNTATHSGLVFRPLGVMHEASKTSHGTMLGIGTSTTTYHPTSGELLKNFVNSLYQWLSRPFLSRIKLFSRTGIFDHWPTMKAASSGRMCCQCDSRIPHARAGLFFRSSLPAGQGNRLSINPCRKTQ